MQSLGPGRFSVGGGGLRGQGWGVSPRDRRGVTSAFAIQRFSFHKAPGVQDPP